MRKEIHICRVDRSRLDDLAPLFDDYRVFYKQPSDIQACRSFLEERIELNESVMFLAYVDNTPAGFTQLYPTLSSITLQRFYILNDLYTSPHFRELGVGKSLLDEAKNLVLKCGMKGLALETENFNPAQKLYEREGWEKDVEYFHYFWKA